MLKQKTAKNLTAFSGGSIRKTSPAPELALNVNSVIAFGRISLVTDEGKARMICEQLCGKFTDDEDYIRRELQNALSRVQCLELTIDHMTGKLVNES